MKIRASSKPIIFMSRRVNNRPGQEMQSVLLLKWEQACSMIIRRWGGNYTGVRSRLSAEIPLFSLFSWRNKPIKQDVPPNQSSQSLLGETCVKYRDDFIISLYLLNNKTLFFEFYHRTQQKIMLNLVIAYEHLSDSAKNVFSDVARLFNQLKKDDVMLYLSPAAFLVVRIKAAACPEPVPAQQDSKNILENTQQHVLASKRAAAKDALKEKRERQEEEVKLLLIVYQNERHFGKEGLRSVETLIQKSRCLPETSALLQTIMKHWKIHLHSALTGNSIEELHLALTICEKYWLRHDLLAQDELMNIMRQRLGRLIDSGAWMLE